MSAPVLDLGLIFGEPAAIDEAAHLIRCHWCAIGSPMCRGVSTADRRVSAEFRALRDLLARISAGGEPSCPSPSVPASADR